MTPSDPTTHTDHTNTTNHINATTSSNAADPAGSSPPTSAPTRVGDRAWAIAQTTSDALTSGARRLPGMVADAQRWALRWWQWLLGATHTGEPSARMFSGIRLRLTLWYCTALAALLLISGVSLYEGMQYALLSPVRTTLTQSASSMSATWRAQVKAYVATTATNPNPSGDPYQNLDPRHGCFVPDAVAQAVPYIECFTQFGLATPPHSVLPQTFEDPSLQTAALKSPSGQAWQIIQIGNCVGAVLCYALVVHDPATGGILGVVQLGQFFQGQTVAQRTLLVMLLIVGALTLVGAAASGLWLANRAMAPARLAVDRQQTFIADAAHEQRTPLTLMRADAEVLLRGRSRLQPGDAELLDDIVGETAHMGALTTNLLTLARLDAGAQRIERDLVDLSEIGAQTIHRAQALADERQITLTNATAPGAGPALVIGDATLLGQVALILLDNALKYTYSGGAVSLRVARVGWQVALEVRDTGVGVAAADLKRLGERFYRVDKARSREMGGAGLGLAIARGVAAAHQGSLPLSSLPDQGTTAPLTQPAATLAGPPAGADPSPSGADNSASTTVQNN